MQLVELLRVLVRHDVEFVLVGRVAAVINGAPLTTFDLDILHRRTPENVRRLIAALTELDATFRTDSRKLRPNESHLLGPGPALLATRLGVLDSLGTPYPWKRSRPPSGVTWRGIEPRDLSPPACLLAAP